MHAGTASNAMIYNLAGVIGVAGTTSTSAPALEAKMNFPDTLAQDPQGNIYITDQSGLYRLAADGSTLQNLGTYPVEAMLFGVAVLANGTILLSRGVKSHTICRYDGPETCTTVAGTPGSILSGAYSGDGGPATSARLNYPMHVTAHPTNPNRFYIADMDNNRIRMVENGIITTVAGSGTEGYSGDGGPATSAALRGPWHVAVDAASNLYVADTYNNRIRWGCATRWLPCCSCGEAGLPGWLHATCCAADCQTAAKVASMRGQPVPVVLCALALCCRPGDPSPWPAKPWQPTTHPSPSVPQEGGRHHRHHHHCCR
jgi:hypothetical protein